MSHRRRGLGSEHPLCDTIQLVMLILFFAVWAVDSAIHYVFRTSTVVAELTSFPLLALPIGLSMSLGSYLALKSHNAVFGKKARQLKLVDAGVYSLVRHPMYLGTLMVCLSFLLAVLSISSIVVWIVFFVIYDRMATYEEEDLSRTFGQKYLTYQKQVPKWFPSVRRRKTGKNVLCPQRRAVIFYDFRTPIQSTGRQRASLAQTIERWSVRKTEI